jgi:hypothetical protein
MLRVTLGEVAWLGTVSAARLGVNSVCVCCGALIESLELATLSVFALTLGSWAQPGDIHWTSILSLRVEQKV